MQGWNIYCTTTNCVKLTEDFLPAAAAGLERVTFLNKLNIYLFTFAGQILITVICV